MGSSSSEFANVMGKNIGAVPNATSPPPVVQQSPPSAQTQAPPQSSSIVELFRMLQNSMLGNGGTGRSQPSQQQSTSQRDAVIMNLMGGGYGR